MMPHTPKNFLVHTDYEFHFFATEADAFGKAQDQLAKFRRDWDDGWPDDVETLVVAKVIHRAEKDDPSKPYQTVEYVLRPALDGLDPADVPRLLEERRELLAACKRALHLVEDEDNNPLIVQMAGSFGLLLDLQTAVRNAERGEASNAATNGN